MVPPFPFIVGCERSGTTLIRAMLDSHPNMAVPPESHFWTEFACARRRVYELASGFELTLFIDALLKEPQFCRWQLRGERLRRRMERAQPQSFASAVREVYAAYAAGHGKSRYADKTPPFVLEIPMFANLFPDAKFVHVVRDGRDVALAWQDVQWKLETVEEVAMYWAMCVSAGRRAGRWLGPLRYLEVRYEDLVEYPERFLRQICEFIDLPFSAVMLQYHLRANAITSFTSQPIFRRLHLPPTAGLRDWETQMRACQVARFECVAGDVLEAAGYRLSG